MKLSKLLYEGEYTGGGDPREIEVSSIVTDTRALTPGCLFICLRGTRFDSHTLLSLVEGKRAAAAIVEQDAMIPEGVTLPLFFVPSTRRAMAFAFSRFFGDPHRDMTMIGVTGTNGKTSTATVLYSILREAGVKVGLIGTAECLYNGKTYTLPEGEDGGSRLRTMTTPDPDVLYPMLRLMRDEGITHVVMEVSSHALMLEKVAPIAYEVGIFTNLSPEHMDFHNDMESYRAAKAILFRQCRVGIFNGDSEHTEAILSEATCEVRRGGTHTRCEHMALDVELRGAAGIAYTYAGPGIRLRIRSTLPGVFSVKNTLLALMAALELGLSPLVAAGALAKRIDVPGRMERVPLGAAEEFCVFIDYAHTEAALRSLLSTVRAFRREGERIVLLFGCGGDRDREKRGPMGKAAEELADRVIVTSDNCRTEDPKRIMEDILAGMTHPERVRTVKSRRRAIEEAILTAEAGDIILLCGKGHETYEITAGGVRHFDEREIVRAALEKRKNGDTDHEN
ncbi:MAG: UDP-N-acetylmuramoyl-L-alanyl-D-glutamate--2,6-diaminopimelate ligase [Clostridia bacterium]|nr:UDP-N-acetylmuramoyl-L-alanyl-D-glutamate--2,6-diaminopimelate ligase [Clostridia bacterium]